MHEGIPQTIPQEDGKEEPLFDPRLEDLWEEYGFKGHPPKKGSLAETRLFDKCRKYALFIDAAGGYSSGQAARAEFEVGHDFAKTKKYSDSERRVLHNEIAIMVTGSKRSGMEISEASHIADFAYEYARGVRYKDSQKFGQEE